MNENESLYELTERYLSGDLSPKEKAGYEQMMLENPALKAHTEKMRKVNELLFMEGLRAELPNIKAAEKQYLLRQQWSQYGKWAGGIVIIAAVITSVWVFSGSKKEETIATPVHKSDQPQTNISSGDKNTPEIIASTPSKNTSPGKLYYVPLEKSTLAPVVIEPNTIPPPVVVPPSLGSFRSPSPYDTATARYGDSGMPRNPCGEKRPVIQISSTASGKNKNDGSITVQIKSGVAPYQMVVNDRVYYNQFYNKNMPVWFLAPQEYTVIVKDGNGCVTEPHTISVEEKTENEKQDYVFSYSAAPDWAFPQLNENSYRFSVYNMAGVEVYAVNVTNGSPSSWEGYSNSGQKLTIGLYSYRFVSEGKILQQGTITVVE